MAMQELPDIPGLSESRERITNQPVKNSNGGVSAGITIATAVILSFAFAALLSFGSVIIGKDRLLSVFGVKPVNMVSENTIAIERIKETLKEYEIDLNRLHDSASKLSVDANAQASVQDLLIKKIDSLETVAESLTKKIEHQSKLSTEKPKVVKRVTAKPKSVPVIPVELISVRYQGGLPCVTLREGLDTSDLLIPGDEWRGWMLIDADPTTRSAKFQVGGKLEELKL